MSRAAARRRVRPQAARHLACPSPPLRQDVVGGTQGGVPAGRGGSTQGQRAAFVSVLLSGPLNEFKNLGHFSG